MNKRVMIITMSQHTTKTKREIASEVGVSLATVNRIIKRHEESGDISVKRKGKCGAKRKTSKRDDQRLLRSSRNDCRKTAVDLARELAETGVNVTPMTVRRRLIEAGRPARKPVKKQLLTVAMKAKRLAWAKKYENWTVEDWKRVLFSDESHFIVQGQQFRFIRRGNEKLNSSHIVQATKHPLKKMFWGCFSYYGPGPLVPVTGMMNSEKYQPMLVERMIPEMKKRWPNGGGIFQQDLAPCHTSKKMVKFFKESHIEVLDWPGNSPDINPIENIWAICKNRMSKSDCTTVEKLISTIIHTWFRDERMLSTCQNLVESMTKRVKLLVEAKGGHIKY
jgi:transposase